MTLAELKKDFFMKQRLYEDGVSPAEGGPTIEELWDHPWHEAMSKAEEYRQVKHE
jgi:hypothetical protein